jgi:hypothetical protein
MFDFNFGPAKIDSGVFGLSKVKLILPLEIIFFEAINRSF